MSLDLYEIKLVNCQCEYFCDFNYSSNYVKKILTKYFDKAFLKGIIKIDIFINKLYGTIITIEKNSYQTRNDTKITIHMDSYFLYEMDYFDINKNVLKDNFVYYYEGKFYLDIKNDILKKDYFNILEFSNIIYGTKCLEIINRGMKIK